MASSLYAPSRGRCRGLLSVGGGAGWKDDRVGVAMGVAGGGRRDPRPSSPSSRPGGNSSLHDETESHLHLQARLVLHPGEAGGLPAVCSAAQVRPWLRRGQTGYGARARGPWGTPLGLSFLGASSGQPGADYPSVHSSRFILPSSPPGQAPPVW